MIRKFLIVIVMSMTAIFTCSTAQPAAAASSGSLTVQLTQPVTVSGTALAQLTCATGRSTYILSSRTVTVDGYQVSANMTVFKYKGAGAYTATVTLSVKALDGSYKAAGAITGVPITITKTGGSWNFSKTSTGAKAPKLAGKTIAGSLGWTCPTA